MPIRFPTRPLAILALVSLAALFGCSKDKGTNTMATTPKELNSDDIGNSGVYAHRFFGPGNFVYHCNRHSTMTHATVIVSTGAPAGDSTQAATIAGFAFSPGTVTIPVGGKVTWTNNDGVPHTVTSD